MTGHPDPAAGDGDLRETPLSDDTVFHGMLIDVSHMRVRLPNGNLAWREVVRHKGAAAVVPVDADGTVTLVRQHRVVVDAITLEIPAGKLERADEDPLSCAHRELAEETGLNARRMELLCPMITTPGFCTERVSIYLATGLSRHDAHPDEDEFLRVVRMPLEEAVKRVTSGELCDGKTALGLMLAWAKLRGPEPREPSIN